MGNKGHGWTTVQQGWSECSCGWQGPSSEATMHGTPREWRVLRGEVVDGYEARIRDLEEALRFFAPYLPVDVARRYLSQEFIDAAEESEAS